MDTLWTLWNRFVAIVAGWFGILTIVCVGGLAWNVSLFVIEAFQAETVQHLYLNSKNLVLGGCVCAALVVLLVAIIDESELW